MEVEMETCIDTSLIYLFIYFLGEKNLLKRFRSETFAQVRQDTKV